MTKEPTDQEIIEAMAELDDDESITLEYSEAGLMQTLLDKQAAKKWTLSRAQRGWALNILEKYGREI